MNDPLDENLENCQWEADNNKLFVMVRPGVIVLAGYELFIAYGEQYWCDDKYSFEILHKAVWRYRSHINLDPDAHWPQHPMFHDLFNTPYNGQVIFPGRTCPCSICSQRSFSPTSSSPPPSLPTPLSSSSTPSVTPVTSRKRTRSPTSSSPPSTQIQEM